MNHLQSLGPLALASRLKNLSDILMQGVARIYREMDLDFEPRWFPVTHYLFIHGSVQVTSLANALQQTHPAILQVANVMKKKGLIRFDKDDKDLRKTIIALTPKGRKMAESLAGIWDDVSLAATKLLEENKVDLINDITLLEKALEAENIYTRVKKEYVRRRLKDIKIQDYTANFYKEFKEMNLQWLKESVGISPYDEKILNDPEEEIIEKGGEIFLAFVGVELAGTVTLIPVNNNDIELTKLVVKKSYRGMGIGEFLTRFALDEAKKDGYRSVILLTHPTLSEAVNLYKKLGFVQISGHSDLPDPTGRCSITMQYMINQ